VGVLLMAAPPPIRPLPLVGVPAQLVAFLTDSVVHGGVPGNGGDFGSLGSGGSGGMRRQGSATSMLDMVKYVQYDEDEFWCFVSLFGLEVAPRPPPPKAKRRGGGAAPPASDGIGSLGSLAAALPTPALARSAEEKRVAERCRAKKAFAADSVAAGQQARAERAARKAMLQAAGVCLGGFGSFILSDAGGDGGGDGDGTMGDGGDAGAAAEARARGTRAAAELLEGLAREQVAGPHGGSTMAAGPKMLGPFCGGDGGDSGGGDTPGGSPPRCSLCSSSGPSTASLVARALSAPVQVWSSELFDAGAFPALRLNAEAFLRNRMHAEALAAMREMLFASLYQGAGGWVTKRVLVVDDSKVIRTFLKRLLQRQGFATDEAANGAAALGLMQRRLYDVAFVDLEMPLMGGLDCATALREWERAIHRPRRQRICAVSGYSDSKERRAALAGFDHYQAKPIRGPLLLELAQNPESASI
jgi:CheY-like chemotaxis protein